MTDRAAIEAELSAVGGWGARHALEQRWIAIATDAEAGDRAAMEAAVALLEVHPRMSQSGHIVDPVIVLITRSPLLAEYTAALRVVVVHWADDGRLRENRETTRLAASIWSEAFALELQKVSADAMAADRRDVAKAIDELIERVGRRV